MEKIVNLGMLAHPMNWIIVFLMLAVGVIGLHLLQPAMQQIAGNTARVL
jgi:hypothetical protein